MNRWEHQMFLPECSYLSRWEQGGNTQKGLICRGSEICSHCSYLNRFSKPSHVRVRVCACIGFLDSKKVGTVGTTLENKCVPTLFPPCSYLAGGNNPPWSNQ